MEVSPWPGKCLRQPSTLFVLEALEELGSHIGHQLGIRPKGAVSDDHVLRVGIDVTHRGKIYVKAVIEQVGTNPVTGVIGVLGISGLTHFLHALVGGHVEVAVFGNTGHPAAFLIYADDRVVAQAVQEAVEFLDL